MPILQRGVQGARAAVREHQKLEGPLIPTLIAARAALDRFQAMLRSKNRARLDPWITMATDTKLAAFDAGVEADRDAVAAAISMP